MTTEELNRAGIRQDATRCAEIMECLPPEVVQNPAGAAEVWMRARRLAKAWLQEHPADDDEPVDIEWLKSIGFTDEKHRPGWCRLLIQIGNISLRFGAGNLVLNGQSLCVGATRCQVRRLLAALGVPSKERVDHAK